MPHSRPAVATPPSAARFISRRTLNLADVGDIASQLEPSGLARGEAQEVSREVVKALGRAPDDIRLILDLERHGETSTLITLEATRSDGTGVMLHRQANGALEAKPIYGTLTRRLTVVRGEIDSNSFYSSAVTAGVTDSLIGEVANAFSYDFDMQREVAPGDVFEVAFEQAYNPANEAVGVPRLAYVSLRTATLSRTLYRFTPPGEREPGWFDGNGASTVRALMRTPVDSARITSQFGMRNHPILGYEKMHRGTDFAAPTGTPVFASGSATVEFAGPKGPNGNFIRLHHDNGWETLYLHLNRILPGVTPGGRVAQGQQIGEIGTTGRSTGPHLHYEVHIDGQPVDPLKIDVGTGQTLTGAALAAFRKQRDAIDTQRAAARQP
ncbi:M23 family metallopeptidase [Novosphingobium rosa]|uniref:M23 family metallopeptidase n=1 Tax=Novosphingobium rosa TaxID=76978 RepID=UPI0012EE13ED|nr:M23 family metallopeptidase [Novosphingobium rosa]